MKPVETKTTNAVYTLDGCADLPATKYIHQGSGEAGIETVWELSPEELAQVQKDGKVFLYVQGESIPPVLLTTESMIVTEEGEG